MDRRWNKNTIIIIIIIIMQRLTRCDGESQARVVSGERCELGITL